MSEKEGAAGNAGAEMLSREAAANVRIFRPKCPKCRWEFSWSAAADN